MIKAILFDLDGTLLDDEWINIEYRIEESKKRGYTITREDVIKNFGASRSFSIEYYSKLYGEDYPFDEIDELRSVFILEHMKKHGYPYKPYAQEIIANLKEAGIKSVICTSSPAHFIDKYRPYGKLFDQIDYLVTGDMITRGKPNPDIFLKGAEVANATADEVLVVEDSNIGCQAAINAKMKAIMVPDIAAPNDFVKENQIKILPSLKEVWEYIKQVNSK